jgi:hypothetical protein
LSRLTSWAESVPAATGAPGKGQAFLFVQRQKTAKSDALAEIGKPLLVAEVAHL